MIDDAGHWIRRARGIGLPMAEERDDIARGGQSDAQHQRILRRVDQFVETAGAERVLDADARRIRPARPRRTLTVGERPIRTRHRVFRVLLPGVVLPGVPRQRRAGLCEIGGAVWLGRPERGEANRRAVRAVGKIEETGDHAAGHGRAVLLARDGNGDRLVRRGRNHVALPAADERDVSLGVRRRLSVPAIDHLIEEDARGFCEIDGLRQREGRDVLDLAARIPWRQAEILDDRVVWISRIHLAVDPSTNQLEGARRTGRLSRHSSARARRSPA